MNKQIGVIGAGNMGSAIVGGLVTGRVVELQQITVFDTNAAKVEALKERYGVNVVTSVIDLAKHVDIVVIAVKPGIVSPVLHEIVGYLHADTIVVSVAAGVTLELMEEIIGSKRKIVRVMPNTPALVNEAMTSITPNSNVTSDELTEIVALFSSFGKTMVVSESLIHAVVGISGSSPAYVFMLIEAMADAAVQAGMARDLAYQAAAQSVLGAAKMVLETGKHPAELKDMVCSPGGTTIEAVKTLEEKGFRAAIIDAIEQCVNKSKRMSER